MTALRAIPGPTAILVAETFGVPLYRYTDSTERARSRFSTEETRSLVKQDPKLIHVDPGDVADAIEDSQIHELKSKALSASDSYQVDVCDRALGNDTVDRIASRDLQLGGGRCLALLATHRSAMNSGQTSRRAGDAKTAAMKVLGG